MSTIKKVSTGLVLILIGLLIWLLFIRSYDLRFKFEVTTIPEIANATLKTWVIAQSNQNEISYDLENLITTHSVKKDGIDYLVVWKIHDPLDSVITVTASVSTKDNKIQNRLGSLIYDTQVKRVGNLIVKDFYDKLSEHLGKVKVRIIGIEEIDDQLCLCINNSTTQFGKAFGMMENFQYLSGELLESGIKIAGNPMVIVNNWDELRDSLDYDFCYAIQEEKKPIGPDFFYRTLGSISAIKAVYNGNYITSDRAWYALRRYAVQNDLEIVEKPIEVFYNNPNIESEETKWRAEVYMPLLNE